mmetsp:Transcript_6539/g.14453  ORF Transcript_6539/g.14453 Transcript_6539/m.14453 type:complete len:436 (-) Transcript_6539:536-1843(-)
MHDESLDDLGAVDALFAVQVRGGFVDEVNVGGFSQCQTDGETLELSPAQRLDAVVHNGIHVERLHDVADELGMDVALADALVEELPHRALEPGRDLLGFVRDVEVGGAGLGGLVREALLLEPGLLVGLEEAGEHAHEGGFSRAVFAQQDDDFGIGEPTRIDVQNELGRALGLRLGHGRITVIPQNVILAQLPSRLGPLANLKAERIVPKPQILRGNESRQKGVDPHSHRKGHGDHSVRTRATIKDADVIRQIIQHGEIVLHHHNVPPIPQFRVLQHLSDHVRRRQPLLHVQVRTRFVEHVHVRNLHRHGRNGKPLQLPPAQHGHVAIQNVAQLPRRVRPIETIPSLFRGPLVLLLENVPHQSPHRAGDVIDVLRLDRGLDVVLQNFGEVVLEVGAAEVDEDLLPVGGGVVPAEVGFHLSREDFEGGGFSDAVGPD